MMKLFNNINKTLFKISFLALLCGMVQAGDPERSGQAGAGELIINPYGISSGLHGLNISWTYGLEAFAVNPAGLAAAKGSEVIFTHTRWLMGSGISLNTVGYSHQFRNGGAFGVNVVAMDLGEFVRTTIDNPDGDLGTFKPNFMYLTIGYAKTFVDERIFVGACVKVINESISDASANGIAIDGGVQYRSENRRFHLGVALRNIGPQMRFRGDGFATRTNLGSTQSENLVSIPSGNFDLPAQLLIGASYDLIKTDVHRLTPTFGFISYSFSQDNLGLGVEYGYKQLIGLRASFLYENGMFDVNERATSFSGLAGGISFYIPMSKKEPAGEEEGNKKKKRKREVKPTFRLDYSYRATFIFKGTHTIGVRLNF